MAEQNVELLRRGLELMGSGDLAASAALFHQDVEVRDLAHLPDTPEYMRGRGAILDSWDKWFEMLDEWAIEVSEYVDADPWFLTSVRWTAKGKGSDAPVEWKLADAYRVEGGEIIQITWGYADIETAQSDLGLSGEGERVFLDPPWSARFRERRSQPRG